MKMIIMLLALTISVDSFAFGVAAVSGNTVRITQNTVGGRGFKLEANQALENIQTFRTSGEFAPELLQQISDLQSQSDMSVEEALDVISNNAEEILK